MSRCIGVTWANVSKVVVICRKLCVCVWGAALKEQCNIPIMDQFCFGSLEMVYILMDKIFHEYSLCLRIAPTVNCRFLYLEQRKETDDWKLHPKFRIMGPNK